MKKMKMLKLFLRDEAATPESELVPVLMPDGTIENYAQDFLITDKTNCIICDSQCYHFYFNCDGLKWEMNQNGKPLIGMTVKEAKKMGKHVCMDCDREVYLFYKGENND